MDPAVKSIEPAEPTDPAIKYSKPADPRNVLINIKFICLGNEPANPAGPAIKSIMPADPGGAGGKVYSDPALRYIIRVRRHYNVQCR